MNKSSLKRTLSLMLISMLVMAVFPLLAYALFALSHEDNHAQSDQGHFTGTNFTYTVGESVSQMFKCNSSTIGFHSESISSGSLPSGLALNRPSDFASDGFLLINGTATMVTSGALAATISAKNSENDTGSLPITFTINKASPTVTADNDTATLGAAKTVTATLAGAYLAGSDSITFTATSGSVSIPATATANGNVNFTLSADAVSTLGVGAHTFTISESATAGNAVANNNMTAIASFSLAVNAAPTILTQPVNQTVALGQTASFTVAAQNGTAPYTYQWQEDTDGGFGDIAGAISDTYTTSATTLEMSGYKYRCIVTALMARALRATARQH